MRSLLTRLALAAGLVVLVLGVLLLALLPGQGEARDRSVFSADDGGWRALYLTLEGLGFPVEAWTRAPGELPARGTLLVLAELPDGPPSVPTAPAGAEAGAEAPPEPRRSRDLAHYRRYVEEGGTLLVLGAHRAELDFLRDELALPGLAEVAFVEREVEPLELELPSGERLSYRARLTGGFTFAHGEVLVRARDGQDELVLGASFSSGAGRVALLALPPQRFGNEMLAGESDRMLLLVRLLEALRPPDGRYERVLFDEYALGAWRPPSVLALAFAPRLAFLSVHVLLLAALLLWRSAWSGPFARDPEPLRAASPLARARGFGRTLARAGRFDLLARSLRRGLFARWDVRSGVPAFGLEEAPGELHGTEADASAEPARLRRLARGDETRLARLEELAARVPASAAELAELEADLGALEPELALVGSTKTRPPTGSHPAVTRS